MIKFLAGIALYCSFEQAAIAQTGPANLPRPQRQDESPSEFYVRRAQEAQLFSVFIESFRANVFTGDLEAASSGSGFILSIDWERDIAYVLTNKHVVDSDYHDVQLLRLNFPSAAGVRDETVSGTVVYESRALDFAIVEFKPSALRSRIIQPAPISTSSEDISTVIRTGRRVAAFGNPMGGRNNFTVGVISQAENSQFGVNMMVKTDAAINPGNSGGSLFDLETGLIVGMNTLKLNGADNSGFAIPVGDLIKEVNGFFNREVQAKSGHIYLEMQPRPFRLIAPESRAKLPSEYLQKFTGLFAVVEAENQSGLLPGDLIIRVDGEEIGMVPGAREQGVLDSPLLSSKISHAAGRILKFEVLRDGEVVSLDVPISSLSEKDRKRKNEFQLLSGMVLQELHPSEAAPYTAYGSGILITRILPGTQAAILQNRGIIQEGSFITEISIKGRTYRPSTIEELNDIFSDVKEGEVINLFAMVPVARSSPSLSTSSSGAIVLERIKRSIIVGAQDLANGKTHPLSELRSNFNWASLGIEHPGRESSFGLVDCRSALRHPRVAGFRLENLSNHAPNASSP